MPTAQPRGRALLAALYDAAVSGAAPGPLTAAAVASLPLHRRPVHVFAIGKAASAMADAALHALREAGLRIAGGIIVAAEPEPSPRSIAAEPEPSRREALEWCVGDHPLPGRRSFAAAARVAERAAAVLGDHVALVLLSGGATSLVAAPIPDLAAPDLVHLYDVLHRAGLDIHTMNGIRKRFSRLGAGRLAVSLPAARSDVLIVSDVPGDDPADIASGMCVPDALTARDVESLLRDAGLLAEIPAPLREHLHAVQRGERAETPKPGDPAFAQVTTRVIGSNRLAVDAILARAAELGLDTERVTEPLTGDAALRGDEVAAALLAHSAHRQRDYVIVWGGETTVRRTGSAEALGGRCQELALAAARRLAAGGEAARNVTILAAGTDGRDGPTDAAGGYADAWVWSAIARGGLDPEQSLARHASHDALDAAGALLRRGPTGTNVMDVVIGLVEERPLHAR